MSRTQHELRLRFIGAAALGDTTMLMELGAANHIDQELKDFALISAARNGQKLAAAWLLRDGADRQSMRALTAALKNGHETTANLLLYQSDKDKERTAHNAGVNASRRAASRGPYFCTRKG